MHYFLKSDENELKEITDEPEKLPWSVDGLSYEIISECHLCTDNV